MQGINYMYYLNNITDKIYSGTLAVIGFHTVIIIANITIIMATTILSSIVLIIFRYNRRDLILVVSGVCIGAGLALTWT